MTEDFSHLTEGSLVVVCGGYGSSFSIAKIDRITKKQALIGIRRFWLKSGFEVGGEKFNGAALSLEPHLFLKSRQQRATRLLASAFPLTREGVTRARTAADYAEKVLRDMDEWEPKVINDD